MEFRVLPACEGKIEGIPACQRIEELRLVAQTMQQEEKSASAANSLMREGRILCQPGIKRFVLTDSGNDQSPCRARVLQPVVADLPEA